MSHFYLYPLLLSQGYPPFQIQQILHSFGLFGNASPLISPSSSFRSLNQNYDHQPSYSRNLILQQNNDNLPSWGLKSQNQNLHTNPKDHLLNDDSIKEEQVESSEKTSEHQHHQKKDEDESSVSKTRRKKKITKMSLKEKREKQLKRNQTQNSKRNVIPNEIHQMLSILFKKNKSSGLVQKLIAKYSALYNTKQLTLQRFYLYHSLLKEKINHYANQQSLNILFELLEPACRIYSKDEQVLYGKMRLTLINYFLSSEATLVILNSKRIKSENKLQHLKTKRYLSYVLKEIISLREKNSVIS